jgi:hypothetical protein
MVRLVRGRGALTNRNGAFVLSDVPTGSYVLTADALGWEPTTIEEVVVMADDTTWVDVSMHPRIIALSEIVVAPSTYGTFERIPATGDPVITVERNTSWTSYIGLPAVRR